MISGPYNTCAGAFTLEFWGCSFLGWLGWSSSIGFFQLSRRLWEDWLENPQSRYPDRCTHSLQQAGSVKKVCPFIWANYNEYLVHIAFVTLYLGFCWMYKPTGFYEALTRQDDKGKRFSETSGLPKSMRQTITTSAEVTLNGGLVREFPPKSPSGLGIILICPVLCQKSKRTTSSFVQFHDFHVSGDQSHKCLVNDNQILENLWSAKVWKFLQVFLTFAWFNLGESDRFGLKPSLALGQWLEIFSTWSLNLEYS